MRWEDSSRARLFYRDREHQAAQLTAAITHAGPLEGKSVLDVGCGYGDLIPYLPPCDYYGIDIDELVLEEARRRWPDHEFAVTDEPRESDVVIAVAALQHSLSPRKTLESWKSAARERLVVVTCTWEHLADNWDDCLEGLVYEEFLSDDDFRTLVVLADTRDYNPGGVTSKETA